MKKGLETWLYSTIGVVAMFAVIVGINLIGNRVKVRVDLTAEHAYTLDPGTRAILSKLDTPVQVRLYCSRSEPYMPVTVKQYAQRVEDLLNEFRQVSKGMVEIQKLDPVPDSDAEDSARIDGIEPQETGRGDQFYIGASVTMLDQKETLPVLNPARERQLEYDLARAISRVASPSKPVVGIMSPLPWQGMNNPMMARMGRRPQPEWVFSSELRRDFTVRPVEMTVDKIPEDIKVLLVIHPQGISDTAQYAIDQFVLRGGKLIAFLDPMAAFDPSGGGPSGGASSSSLPKLLPAWGLSFDATQVVADKNYAYSEGSRRDPLILELVDPALNKDDVATSSARNLILLLSGAFTGTPAEGLKQTVLMKSSNKAQLIDPMMAQLGPDAVMKGLKDAGAEYNLAVKLTGKFKTAFPAGKPKAETPEGEKPDEKKPEPPAEPGLKESKVETTVLLVGDSDLVQDQVAAQVYMTRDGMAAPRCGNLAFAQSAVDQMAGDENLIAVRSRASNERPFTVVKKIQNDAEEKYRSAFEDFAKSRNEIATKLSQLRGAAAERGQEAVSAEKRKQIDAYNKKVGEINKQEKELRKNMMADINALKTRTTWMNLALMPLFVILLGVTLAILRRYKQAAR